MPKWKTGFYHIAKSAKVPIIMGFVDFKMKKLICPVFNISGDFEKDMSKINHFPKIRVVNFQVNTILIF